MAHRASGRLVRVVASAAFSFLAWDASVEQLPGDGGKVFVCKAMGDALQWHHLLELEDWLVLSTKPRLLTTQGPLGWQQTEQPPLFLPQALCMRGLPLITKQQLLQLIFLLGGSPPANADKRALQIFLIQNIMPETLPVLRRFLCFFLMFVVPYDTERIPSEILTLLDSMITLITPSTSSSRVSLEPYCKQYESPQTPP